MLYSSCTILVITLGSGVYGFTLDPNVGEYVLTHPLIQVPEVRLAWLLFGGLAWL